MREIIQCNEPFVREEWDRDEAIKHIEGMGEAEEGTVALRRLGGRDQEVLPLADAIAALLAEGTMPGGEGSRW